VCRLCGGCMYICPACQLRCQGAEPPTVLCGGCPKFEPTCIEHYDDYQCWMGGAAECGGCVQEKIGGKKKPESRNT
jgi:bidirectional [NiFe] hydrogenase diaphorase subunit